MCFRRATQHEPQSGQDQSAAEDAVRVERIDGDRRARVDDDTRRREQVGRRRALPRGDERRPPVRAELRGLRVAVGDAAGECRGAQPFRRDAPARELRLDAHPRRLAGDVDAHDARGTRQVVPVTQRQRANLAVGGHAERHPPARAAQSPFHPAVADVDDEYPAQYHTPGASRCPSGGSARAPARRRYAHHWRCAPSLGGRPATLMRGAA